MSEHQDDDDALAELSRAVEGLTYPSETDAPFEAFCWGAGGASSGRERVEALAGGRAVVEVPVARFFAELEEVEDAEGFRRLRRVLRERLSDVRVFRVGERRVDVYLVGKTAKGEWAGLHTVSVET